MSKPVWVIFDETTSRLVGTKTFSTKGHANQSAVAAIRRKLNRYFASPDTNWGKMYQKEAQHIADNWTVVTLDEYNKNHRKTRTVVNLLSGKEVEIDINTPACCDPSTETYHCM